MVLSARPAGRRRGAWLHYGGAGRGLTTAKAPVGTMMLMARARKSVLKKMFPRLSGVALLSVNYYPIFENALRHHLGRDMPTHMQKLGELMQPFTEVAAQNPYSWFPSRAGKEMPVNEPIAWLVIPIQNI